MADDQAEFDAENCYAVSDFLIKAKGGFTKTLRNKRDNAEMWQYIVDAVYWFIMHVTVHMYTKVSLLSLLLLVQSTTQKCLSIVDDVGRNEGQDEEESWTSHI